MGIAEIVANVPVNKELKQNAANRFGLLAVSYLGA